jgi:trimethylamine--corrinoid protein Co-methyltransferase
MQATLKLLDDELTRRILAEAFELLMDPGVKVQSHEALDLLAAAGARVEGEIVRIPQALVRTALESTPREFFLYNRAGEPCVRYGGDAVHFDPGSCGVNVLDPVTLEHRPSQAADLLRLVQVTECLPQYAAQSTAVTCADVPKEIGDLYRLFLVLLHSDKPVVTGAFSIPTTGVMIELLAADSGGREALKDKPRAVFDACPSPPLHWSAFGAQSLVDLARAGVPAEIVSMPLAGATAPVTLAGSVVQHAAECLSGIAIHQVAQPGAPVVWGGAPAIFDMRAGTTPMGAVETAMIDVAYAQVGKSLGLPTHTYLGASDSKLVDAQAGLESGVTAIIGALGGINMISGAGMLAFLTCQSAEKLVVDAEAIAMAERLLAGIEPRGESLATAAFALAGLRGEFLKLKETRRLFQMEQHLPSAVIDRGSVRAWQEKGAPDTFALARARVDELLAAYRRPGLAAERERALFAIVTHEASKVGMGRLPGT